jgi:hypothetical protein
MIRSVSIHGDPSEASKSTNQDLDADFEGLERRKILAGRAYQQGVKFISVDFILKEIGMQQYIDDFIQANEDMMEAHEFRTDEEVDAILRNVEKTSGVKFPYRHRCVIWKALRFDWFKSSETSKDFIDRSEIPVLILPKKDFRTRDDMLDLKSLDSDRQRMVRRRTILDEVEGTIVIQDEIFSRMPHLYYELEGLERTVQYWMSQDPRKMAREDPREEVLLNQIKAMELQVAVMIDELKQAGHVKKIVVSFFNVTKVIFACATVAFLILSIVEAQSASVPAMEAFASQPYLRLASLYFWTFWFIFEATRPKRRHTSTNYDLVRNMHAKCRLMNSDMISFRLKTHYIRQHRIPRFLDDLTLQQEEKGRTESNDNITGKEAGAFDGRMSSISRPIGQQADNEMKVGSVLTRQADPVENRVTMPSFRGSGIPDAIEESERHGRRATVRKPGTVQRVGARTESHTDLVRIRSSSSNRSLDEESPNMPQRVDSFYMAQGELFADQRREEAARFESMVTRLEDEVERTSSPEASEPSVKPNLFPDN